MMSLAEEPGSTTSHTNEKIGIDEATKLLLSGKKHYANKDINAACESFEKACSWLASNFGQTANECGEAYFYYGKSLLDIARAESDVLGNMSSKDDVTKKCHEEGTQKMEMKNNDTTAMERSYEHPKEDGMVAEAKPTDEKEILDKNNTPKGEEFLTDDTSEEGCEDGSNSSESKDEVGNMQLAWEMLELCRIIFARQESKDMQMKQAQANLALGEIGMELEHYPEAIGDFMECLRLLEQILDSDDRLLAETFYNLGLAYSFDRHYGKATEYYNKAITVIKLRICNLKSQSDQEDNSIIKEINDLGNLIPDILAKVEDAEYMKRSTEEIIKTAAEIANESVMDKSICTFEEPIALEESRKTEAVVTNISHLVRKKRKPDETTDSMHDYNKKKRPNKHSKDGKIADTL